MSRVHNALRRTAGLQGQIVGSAPGLSGTTTGTLDFTSIAPALASMGHAVVSNDPFAGLLERIQEVNWAPNPEAHVIDIDRPSESPTEEFRSLRTRLNHMKGLQPLSTLVVTSPSPAEGKSFTATNLAVVQSHLQDNFTLLCDFDFRRPLMHQIFNLERTPGLTDYLQGNAELHEVIRRVKGTNLFLAPAGGTVLNPLELLNLPQVRQLFEELPKFFNWVILDSPPLLFAADANLLSTMTDGTLLVVRLAHTTIDSVTRAIQSMSHNNVLGVVANGAKRGELYSKYTYYHSYYYEKTDAEGAIEGVDHNAPAVADYESPTSHDEDEE